MSFQMHPLWMTRESQIYCFNYIHLTCGAISTPSIRNYKRKRSLATTPWQDPSPTTATPPQPPWNPAQSSQPSNPLELPRSSKAFTSSIPIQPPLPPFTSFLSFSSHQHHGFFPAFRALRYPLWRVAFCTHTGGFQISSGWQYER